MPRQTPLAALPADILVDSLTAAEMLQLSHANLRKRRERGQPPRFIKLGRAVRYRLPDLAEYEDQQPPRLGEEQ